MPDDMGSWINERIVNGQYNNESEYFRDLVRKDQEKQNNMAELRKTLIASEMSGVSDKTVEDIMKEVEDRLDGQLSAN